MLKKISGETISICCLVVMATLSCKKTSDKQIQQDQAKVAKADSVASLWRRLDSLEKKVDTLKTKTEASLSSLRSRVESLVPKAVDTNAEGASFPDPHARKNITPDEFGRDLFAILKNKDLEGIKKYLWHDQDWVIIAELGHPATKEQIDEYKEKAVPQINAGVTKYHDRYFNIGGIYYDAPTEPTRQLGTLTSVEYVGFIPGIARYSSPRFTN